MDEATKEAWGSYRDAELARLSPVLTELGYALDPKQVHIQGERYLQSGWKLVLTGTRVSDGKRVIIKGSSHPSGMEELAHEHARRRLLHDLPFAYQTFHSPEELLFTRRGGALIAVTEFLDEERGFLEYPLSEQFFLALHAFRAQEGLHATTAGHARAARKAFGFRGAQDYLASFAAFSKAVSSASPEDHSLIRTMERCSSLLAEHGEIIDGYAGFLTHTDFVPHNLRIHDGQLYLLDYTSLVFGNKYESWARFTNYMSLYNPPLERALCEYVRLNRDPLEYLSLRLMRLYKLGFLLSFYVTSLPRTTGGLRTLTERRIRFWQELSEAVLEDRELPADTVDAYTRERDLLRTDEEKARQRVLKQL